MPRRFTALEDGCNVKPAGTRTVNVASEEVTLLTAFLTRTEYAPPANSVAFTDSEALLPPAIATPSLRH